MLTHESQIGDERPTPKPNARYCRYSPTTLAPRTLYIISSSTEQLRVGNTRASGLGRRPPLGAFSRSHPTWVSRDGRYPCSFPLTILQGLGEPARALVTDIFDR